MREQNKEEKSVCCSGALRCALSSLGAVHVAAVTRNRGCACTLAAISARRLVPSQPLLHVRLLASLHFPMLRYGARLEAFPLM